MSRPLGENYPADCRPNHDINVISPEMVGDLFTERADKSRKRIDGIFVGVIAAVIPAIFFLSIDEMVTCNYGTCFGKNPFYFFLIHNFTSLSFYCDALD